MPDTRIKFVATAKGTWPYYFPASSYAEAEKFCYEKLNHNGKFDYEWTINIDLRGVEIIDDAGQ